jgi:hypothetical protein
MQIACGAGEAAMPGYRFEIAQRVERRQLVPVLCRVLVPVSVLALVLVLVLVLAWIPALFVVSVSIHDVTFFLH